jgi:hypothetical protein
LDGLMDSSFLTVANVGLGIYAALLFLKMVIQFGLPNHPARFTAYLVALCATIFFGGRALVGLSLLNPWQWTRLEALPLVTGGLALLLQTIMMLGNFSLIQQKIVSRLPLIAGLICLTVFPNSAPVFFGLIVAAGCIFLALSKGRARYQKRLFFKMVLFLCLFWLCRLPQEYALFVVGQLFLFFALFYLFLFEQAFGVSALMDQGVRE